MAVFSLCSTKGIVLSWQSVLATLVFSDGLFNKWPKELANGRKVNKHRNACGHDFVSRADLYASVTGSVAGVGSFLLANGQRAATFPDYVSG